MSCFDGTIYVSVTLQPRQPHADRLASTEDGDDGDDERKAVSLGEKF